MTIDQQLQALVEQAPQQGVNPDEMQVIALVFKLIASRLQHLQYYILQNLDQDWVMTTLKHRTEAELTKHVIYAYPSLEVVKASVAIPDLQIVALPVPVIQILFQLIAMEPIDSIIFFETANTQQSGTEISRQMLRSTIEQSIRARHSSLPPDIA